MSDLLRFLLQDQINFAYEGIAQKKKKKNKIKKTHAGGVRNKNKKIVDFQ